MKLQISLAIFFITFVNMGQIVTQNPIFTDHPNWQSLASGHYATGLGVADINGDNWKDIIVANGNDMARQNLAVYYNNGDGTFPTSPSWQSADIDYLGHLAVGDINGDNWPDVAVSVFLGPGRFNDPGHVKVYYNDAGQLQTLPTFRSSDDFFTFSCVLGDADGDGDLDLAVAGGQPYNLGIGPYQTCGRIYYNQSGVLDTLPAWQSSVVMGAMDVDFADFDNNGYLDVAFAAHLTPNYIFLADSSGQIHSVPDWQSQDNSYYANSLTVARVDDNDYPDLIISDNDQLGGAGKYKAYYFSGPPSGQSNPGWYSSSGGYGSAVLASDITLNGKPDLLTGRWWGRVEHYKDTLHSFTTMPVWLSTSNSVIEAFVLADVNKDGLQQILYRDTVVLDSQHVFDLGTPLVEDILAVRVNGALLNSGADYCNVPGGRWISTRLPLMAGDMVEADLQVSHKQDLVVSNWDPSVGNYIFYNQRQLTGLISQQNVPVQLNLQVYPNPFNNRCTFEVYLQKRADVQITVYNMLGQVVRIISQEPLEAGIHRLGWDGKDDRGQEMSSGMYIYLLMASKKRLTGKLLMLK
jgi:hypothetical protein